MATRIFSPALNEMQPGPELCVEPHAAIVEGVALPLFIRRIIVSIRPVIAGEVNLSHLDANGHGLHCVWKFPDQRQIWRNSLVRVPQFSPGQETDAPVFVESNAGSFRIPRGVGLFWAGGQEGDPWDVDVIEYLDHNYGHPDLFTLDTLTADQGVEIFRPDLHAVVLVMAGSLLIDGLATVDQTSGPVSLAHPSIVTAEDNTLYRTEVFI